MATPQPQTPPAIAQLVLEASGHYQQNRLAEAEAAIYRILALAPDNADALHLLALIRLKQGRADDALPLIEDSLRHDAGSPNALASRGRVLAALNRCEEALASFDAALAVAPNDADTLSNRGTMLLNLGRPEEALAALDRAVALAPLHFGARMNRGNALALLRREEEALAQYDALLVAHPARAELHFNRGTALAGLGRHAEAIAAFDRALASQPDYVRAHINRGTSFQALTRHREALDCFKNALTIERTSQEARHNAALSLLTLGQYRPGFIQYEARLSNTPGRRRDFGQPPWLGEASPSGQTVLLHAEQGFGDTIQFVRYAPLLARQGARVVLECPPELVGLLRRVEGVSEIVAQGESLPAFDLHCPLPSLPLAFGTELDTLPAQFPYLEASAEKIAEWRTRLSHLHNLRVAIAWAGRASHPNDRNRSIPLARFARLFNCDGVSFISVQHDISAEDAATLAQSPEITDIGSQLHDFDDAAAVLSLVDLAISVDTSVANLAGALGRPTWVLLPFSPDWRWMLERNSPWYPAARLYRQRALGDWDGVIAAARKDLATHRL